jgi:hypothetical protein
MESAPAPGWYPDPRSPSQQRYWDGQGWTNSTAPGVAALGPTGDIGPAPQASPAPTHVGPPGAQAPVPYGAPQGAQHQQPYGSGARDHAEPPYYQQAFAQFDRGGSKVAWNWAAFLLGALWYLYRGMWAKALIYFAVAFFTGGLLVIPVWIYGGLMGTHDYYLLRRKGTQGW